MVGGGVVRGRECSGARLAHVQCCPAGRLPGGRQLGAPSQGMGRGRGAGGTAAGGWGEDTGVCLPWGCRQPEPAQSSSSHALEAGVQERGGLRALPAPPSSLQPLPRSSLGLPCVSESPSLLSHKDSTQGTRVPSDSSAKSNFQIRSILRYWGQDPDLSPGGSGLRLICWGLGLQLISWGKKFSLPASVTCTELGVNRV